MRQHSLFIADLHLDENSPETHHCFTQFVKQYAPLSDAIYILGDFFEYWIGDDATTPFHQEIIAALKVLTESGIPVFFMHGNRDFLIGKKFSQDTGCRIIADPHLITLYGHSVLLTHGDFLCTLDKQHLRFRRLTQKRYLTRIFTMLPISYRKLIAKKMRDNSKKHTKILMPHVMDVTEKAVVAAMYKHKTNYLIHGHTHRPEIHQVELHPQSEKLSRYGERIVLGAWHNQGNALKWYADGEKELFWF